MANPKSLSTWVKRLSDSPEYVRRLTYIEAQLRSRSFIPEEVFDKNSVNFDRITKRIIAVTDESKNGFEVALYVDLDGRVVMTPGLRKTAKLSYDSLSGLNVLIFCCKTPLVDLWIGDRNSEQLSFYDRNIKLPLKASFRIFPENPNNIPGFGVYDESSEESISERGQHVTAWLYHARTHSLEELASMPYVEPNMLALHQLAGNDFRYAVIFPSDDPPGEHHLVFQTPKLTKDEIFTRSVDALCRIVDSYNAHVPIKETVVAMPK